MTLTQQHATKAGRSKAARARKLGESVSYHTYLIGIAWAGFEGTYDYQFDHAPTAEEVKAKAGDFQAIMDFETQAVRTIRYTDGERRIVKTVRPWANEDSVDKYCGANGC
jgi:hypothetical protein